MVFIRLPHSGLVLVAERVNGGFMCHEHENTFFATDEVDEVGEV